MHPWARVDGEAPDKPLDPAVLTKLKHFSAMNKLKKLALKVSSRSSHSGAESQGGVDRK